MINSVTKLGAAALFASVLLSSAMPASAHHLSKYYAARKHLSELYKAQHAFDNDQNLVPVNEKPCPLPWGLPCFPYK